MSDSMKIGLAAAALLVVAVFYFRLRSAPALEAPLAPVTEAGRPASAAPAQAVPARTVSSSPDLIKAPMPKSGDSKIRGAEILAPGSKPKSPHTWPGMEPDPSAGVDPSQGPDPKAGPQKTQ